MPFQNVQYVFYQNLFSYVVQNYEKIFIWLPSLIVYNLNVHRLALLPGNSDSRIKRDEVEAFFSSVRLSPDSDSLDFVGFIFDDDGDFPAALANRVVQTGESNLFVHYKHVVVLKHVLVLPNLALHDYKVSFRTQNAPECPLVPNRVDLSVRLEYLIQLLKVHIL